MKFSPPTSPRLIRAVAAAATIAAAFPSLAQPRPIFRLIDINQTGQSALNLATDRFSFAAAGSSLYFGSWSATEGYELWRSDGTESGTQLVADLAPGPISSAPAQFFPDGDRLFFIAGDQSGITQVFVADPSGLTTLSALTAFGPGLGEPALLAAANGTAYFTFPSGDAMGLYRTSAPAAPPVLLRTFAAGPSGPIFGATDTAIDDRYLYFAADDGTHGRELWRTDGTPSGTALLADIVPGPLGSSPSALALMDGRVLLAAHTPQFGTEPWVYEATGARMVADLETATDAGGAPFGSAPDGFTAINGRIVFAARSMSSDGGRELWATDPGATAGATRLLLDIRLGPSDGLAGRFSPVRIGDALYFTADDGTHGTEIWRTDGTTAGTRLCLDMRPGPPASSPVLVGHMNGQMNGQMNGDLIFQSLSDHAPSVHRLFKFSPAASCDAVTRLCPLPFSDDQATNLTTPRPVAILSNQLLFPAFRHDCGLELFRSAGAPDDAALVKDIRSGTLSSAPGPLTPFGPGVLFGARTEIGVEPWFAAAAPDTAALLIDALPGRASSSPASFVTAPAFALFRAGGQWWSAPAPSPIDPGTAPIVVTPIGVLDPLLSTPPRMAELNGLVIFAGRTAGTGDEPHVSDGRAAATGGTRLLADIVAGPTASSPFGFVRAGPRVYFFAAAAPGSVQLWSTDGTPEQTARLAVLINPAGRRVVNAQVRPVAAGDRIFFIADNGSGDALWTCDGSDDGAYRVAGIAPGPADFNPQTLAPVRSEGGQWRVFFSAYDNAHGQELWVSGGAPLGADTALVKDIAPGPASGAPFSIIADSANNRVFFSSSDGLTGFELWCSDGTDAGTRRITQLSPDPSSGVQSILAVVDSRIYFRLIEQGTGTLFGRLCRADPAPGGNFTVTTILDPAGQPIAPTTAIVPINNRLFFGASDRQLGSELGLLDLCPADFDNSGAVELTDLFAYLRAFFTQYGLDGPWLTSDFTLDQRVGIGDLFEFLAMYFRGCG